LSSVHFALDTRIFYRMCRSLSSIYTVHLIAVHEKEETKEGIHIIPFKRYHSRNFRMAFAWLHMFFKALKTKAKIFHLHDPELIPCGMLLKMMGKKVILDIHENIAEDIFDKPWIRNQNWAYKVFHIFEKWACKNFFILLAESSYEKRYKKLNAKYEVVQNFCDTKFFTPFVKTEYQHKLNLFYIGIILENRGILQICEVLNKLNQEGYQANFHCVGELYSDLEKKIKNLPYYQSIENQLHFYGRLPLDEGYKMAKDMDIGLCIIWPMNNSRESYPTKLFEYMAVGLPILTSNFDLYKKTVEDNFCGVCIDPFDTEKIKIEILELHSDVKKSEQMGENGKIIVENKYNWKSQSPILTKVYRQLLGQLQEN
jgi:glycosyltransferase involved in cell wall biosynthesis